MKKIYIIVMAAIMSLMGSLAFADFKPAVIYDMGGKFDKSFNEGVYTGIKRFTAETGIEVMEFEVTNEAQRLQAMEKNDTAWCYISVGRRLCSSRRDR